MTVSGVGSATGSSFFTGLRKVLSGSFGSDGLVRPPEDGRFSISGGNMLFIPNLRSSNPHHNHVTVDKNLRNRFAAKVDVEGDFSAATYKSVGMVVKKQDKDNMLVIEVNSKEEVRLVKYQDGNKSVLKSVKLDESLSSEFEMAVDVNNSKIKFSIDGEEVFSETDSSFRGGEFGFGSFTGTSTFSNLEVYQ